LLLRFGFHELCADKEMEGWGKGRMGMEVRVMAFLKIRKSPSSSLSSRAPIPFCSYVLCFVKLF
jgi:hypothetical protein